MVLVVSYPGLSTAIAAALVLHPATHTATVVSYPVFGTDSPVVFVSRLYCMSNR